MADTITFKLDLDLSDIPKADQAEAKKAVADFVLEQILADCDDGRSSVSGKQWKGLTAEYKHFKQKESSHPKANLELSGALLDSLEYKIKKDYIEIGWFDQDQVPKADGHNNFSGDSALPLRQSIPKKSQEFRPGINDEVGRILEEYRVAPSEGDDAS